MTNDEKIIKTRMAKDGFSAFSHLVICSGFWFRISGFLNIYAK